MSNAVSALRRTALSLFLLLLLPVGAIAANWPAWRGPLGTGICEEQNLPIQWTPTDNVKWRTPLAQRGNSTTESSFGKRALPLPKRSRPTAQIHIVRPRPSPMVSA
jgi:hypothetical protein